MNMRMPFSVEELEILQALTGVDINPQETEEFITEYNNLMGWLDKIKVLDVSDVIPTTNGLRISNNAFREDIIEDSFSVEEALMNAPEADGNAFIVPSIY
ncbi:MAG: Asp-tRNA(Asn)/Glu-tRNA(Gln) amidotransferase subunit GatC [Clostridia bacterium]